MKRRIAPHWKWLIIASVAALSFLFVLNRAVSYFGDTHVFAFSPFHIKNKVSALVTYGLHRPVCWIQGHERFGPLVGAAERRYAIPSGLLASLIEVESEGRPHRISTTGAMGFGQIMPSTAKMLDLEDPFSSAPAIDASARYLAEQLRRFRSIPLAVAAYNAGPGAVRGGRIPQNGETEIYVRRVLGRYERNRPRTPAPKKAIAAAAKGKRA